MTTSWQLQNAQRQLAQLRGRDRSRANSAALWQLPLPIEEPAPTPTAAEPLVATNQTAVTHHPDIAIAAQKAGYSCHYQLWLIMRHLDSTGNGRLSLATLKDTITKESSDRCLYNWPRLRQILKEGNGRFWHYAEQQPFVYYKSTHQAAAELDIEKLNGRFVQLLTDHMYCSLKRFRAWCFTGWLANRENPITQGTIQRITGIHPRSQARYCTMTRVKSSQNIAIGPRWETEAVQEAAWHHPSTFKFTDHQGQQGPAKRQYIAWHLPIKYTVKHVEVCAKSRTRRTNIRLSNLMHSGTRGNVETNVRARIFFNNGKAAAKQVNRQTSGDVQDVYWFNRAARSGTGIWSAITC